MSSAASSRLAPPPHDPVSVKTLAIMLAKEPSFLEHALGMTASSAVSLATLPLLRQALPLLHQTLPLLHQALVPTSSPLPLERKVSLTSTVAADAMDLAREASTVAV